MVRTLPARVLAFHVALSGFGCGAEPLKVEGPASALTDTRTFWTEAADATAVVPSTPSPSTVTASTGPTCAAVLAAISPIRTELPAPPMVTWLEAVVVASLPTAVESTKSAVAPLPMAVAPLARASA